MGKTPDLIVREAEGSREGALARGRGPGRPRGVPNRPKSLVPRELANEILLVMKDQLPPEHFEYMKGVIRDGKAISTKSELDVLILLLSRNLYGALIDEMRPPAEPQSLTEAIELVEDTGKTQPPQRLRRDVTERLKVLNSFLSLRHQIEKQEKGEGEGDDHPVMKLWMNRGMQGRVGIMIQGANTDGPEPADNRRGPFPALPAGSADGDAD